MRLLLLTMCFAVLCLTAQADVRLTFGVYASDKPLTMVKKFRHTLSEIERHMEVTLNEPVKIKIHVARTYEQGISDLVEGHVDFARFGPVSYVEAKSLNPKIGILALESIKGEKTFYGILATHMNSTINSVDDLKGKKVAFGNKGSTIGRYLAQQYLAENKIYAYDLEKFDYLDRHDAVGEAVGIGTFDAGFLKEGTFKKQIESGVALREVARFPNVTKPWLYAGGMSPHVARALRLALLEMDNPKIVADGSFIEGSDDDFSEIRKSIQGNRVFFKGE